MQLHRRGEIEGRLDGNDGAALAAVAIAAPPTRRLCHVDLAVCRNRRDRYRPEHGSDRRGLRQWWKVPPVVGFCLKRGPWATPGSPIFIAGGPLHRAGTLQIIGRGCLHL